jgi:hypothetical protein
MPGSPIGSDRRSRRLATVLLVSAFDPGHRGKLVDREVDV